VSAIVLLLAGAAIAWPSTIAERVTSAATATDAWVPFSKQKLAGLRSEGRAVFIDFTATWCITCQVNKRIALNRAEVVKKFDEMKIVRMKADWTVKDPAITEALAEFGRNGVPLYVYYPSGGEAQLLPEVLTADVVMSALDAPRLAAAAK
jgi:thiol:disulfide interchange protein